MLEKEIVAQNPSVEVVMNVVTVFIFDLLVEFLNLFDDPLNLKIVFFELFVVLFR